MKRERKKRSGGGDITLLTEFDQASTMDYLHGDVVDGEHEAACDYEYSRESRVLREAARLHRQGLSPEEIGEDIDQAFHCGGLFLQSPWFEFFTSAHFPETPWNSLSEEARARILRAFPLPFGKGQLRSVDLAALERLQTAGRLTAGQHSPVVFAFDWAKAKKQHCHEFKAWLDRPANKERLAKYRNRRTGKTGGHADRLKDLAAWRLFEHCGGDWRKANDFASEHRKVFESPDYVVVVSGKKRRKISFEEGEPRPFHDPRQGQGKQQINAASLYSEESGFLRAKGRARAYLERRTPWEFFKKAAEEVLENMRARIERLSVAFFQGTAEASKEAAPPPSQL